MPTPLTFDIFLDTTGPMAPCRLLTNADSSQPAVQPALVQADKLTVRLWLVVPATTIGAAATTLSHTGTIILALKADQSDTDLLALCSNFASATVDGRTCYTGELNLNTAAMATAFSSPSVDILNAWFDVELSNVSYRQTFQNRVTIYREVYNGTQPPPVDLPEWPIPATVMIKPSPAPAENMIAVFSNTSPGNVKDSGVDVLEVCTRENDTLSNDDYLALFVNGLEAPGYDPEITSKDSTGSRISANGLVRADVDQTAKSESWKAQARANIGVVTAGGVALSANAWAVAPRVVSGTGDYTIHAIINLRAATADQWLCGYTDSATVGYGASLFTINADLGGSNLQVLARKDNETLASITIGTVASFVGSQKHIIVTVASGVATAYVNGTQVGTSTSAQWNTTALLGAFVGKDGNTDAADGDVLKLQRFNRALTAGERAAVMRGDFTAAMKAACIARYEPGDVTSLGRWIDSSGNGYDLIPGAGITPLKPQPVQVRMEECLYDLGSSVAADAPAGWTLAKTGTGILTMTPPAYVKAIKPPIVTANSANGGYTVDTAVNQSTGVVTVTSRNAGEPADSVLYIVAAHRE